jgi:hypothetical protein
MNPEDKESQPNQANNPSETQANEGTPVTESKPQKTRATYVAKPLGKQPFELFHLFFFLLLSPFLFFFLSICIS